MRLIDADALKAYIDAQKGRPFIGCTIGEALKIITDEQPTIEERKTGEWIKEDSYMNRWGEIIEIQRCPICEFKHDYSCGATSKDDDGWFNFCPYCGADMRGNENETD